MSAAVARLRPVWTNAVAAVAAWAGSVVRSVPGLGGAVLICGGLYDAWRPLGIIAAGLFLLAVDRQMP